MKCNENYFAVFVCAQKSKKAKKFLDEKVAGFAVFEVNPKKLCFKNKFFSPFLLQLLGILSNQNLPVQKLFRKA